MNKWTIVILVSGLVGCGVKGPPEPPLPTEASLKKQTQLQESESQEKTKTPATKKPKAQ